MIYLSGNPEENERIKRIKKWFDRLKPIYTIAYFLYIALCAIERPCWCI